MLQEFIHKIEVGPWYRHLRNGVIALAALTLFVGYNWRCYHNMNTLEAMDAAQVGRNLAEGRGFTTYFIRPLSMGLVQKHNEARYGLVPQEPHTDYAEVKGMHPDLANPPVYPCVLALWLKTYHAGFKVMNGITDILPGSLKSKLPVWNDDSKNPFWEINGKFWWWPADFCIAMLNEGLFFVVIVMTFLLARRLFDLNVAWLSVLLVAGTELLWRFAASGLSTMLLLVIFMALAWCVVFLEQEVREPKWGPKGLLLLPIMAGLLLGIGAMTRYSFGCLVVPVGLFLFWYGGPKRVAMITTVVVTFAVVCTPWIIRNYSVSGTPFGTAGFAILDGTYPFPEHRLERSLHPDLNFDLAKLVSRKLATNLRDMLQDELPRLGGSWVMPFFLVGLMLGFRNQALTRLRNFILTCIGMLAVAQALGRTGLSEDEREVNAENLLVLLTPLVLVYGISLFFVLLDQMKQLRTNHRVKIIGLFGFVTWLPLIGALLPPRTLAVAYPPYSPPTIRIICGWMNERELMMSDVPWAVAWYGKRQCVWLSLNCREDFFAINDFIKPVRAVYLTPMTLDSRFLSQWVRPGERSWGSFIIEGLLQKEIPPNFPLRAAPNGFMPEQFFVTDWARWKVGAVTNGTSGP